MRGHWGPAEKLRRDVDCAIHNFVNEKLRVAGRSGYGTVQRDGATSYLNSFIKREQITGEELTEMIDSVVAGAVVEYVRSVARHVANIYYSLEKTNETIDSLSLQRFIEANHEEWLAEETAALMELVRVKEDAS